MRVELRAIGVAIWLAFDLELDLYCFGISGFWPSLDQRLIMCASYLCRGCAGYGVQAAVW